MCNRQWRGTSLCNYFNLFKTWHVCNGLKNYFIKKTELIFKNLKTRKKINFKKKTKKNWIFFKKSKISENILIFLPKHSKISLYYFFWIFFKNISKVSKYSKFRNFIIYIKKTTSFSSFGLTVSFQKCSQFSIQITHVTNR